MQSDEIRISVVRADPVATIPPQAIEVGYEVIAAESFEARQARLHDVLRGLTQLALDSTTESGRGESWLRVSITLMPADGMLGLILEPRMLLFLAEAGAELVLDSWSWSVPITVQSADNIDR